MLWQECISRLTHQLRCSLLEARCYAVPCSCDVAEVEALVWEGFMAHQTPAYLLRKTINVEVYAPERQEQLSTGMYVLADIRCRGCCTPMGWRYISAQSEASPQATVIGGADAAQEVLYVLTASSEPSISVSERWCILAAML